MLAQIQDNTYKAYVALQSYVTPPANIPIPGVIRTDRAKLTREQIAARYLKSVEGNPDIDINKAKGQGQQIAPKMTQKSSASSIKDQWPALANAEFSIESKTTQIGRNLLATEGECVPDVYVYVSEAQKISDKLTYEIYGVTDAIHPPCMEDTPVFVVCSDEYLKLTNLRSWNYPAQTMWYRKNPDWDTQDYQPQSQPSSDKINAEIHEALRNNKATRIYLSPEQLDAYLSWRLSHGGSINFQYIRVDDEANVSHRNTMIGVGIIAGIGFCSLAGLIAHSACKRPVKTDEQEKKDEKTNHISNNNTDRQASDKKNIFNKPEEAVASINPRHQDTSSDTPSSSDSSSTPPTSLASSSIVTVSTSDDDSTSDDTVVHITDQNTDK